jgi:hypothetical protein
VAILRIELQDGFDDDEVICTLDGREVARRAGVQTDLRISRADAIPLDVSPGEHVLGVGVPTRGLYTELPVHVRESDLYVTVRVLDGRLHTAVLDEAPGYL